MIELRELVKEGTHPFSGHQKFQYREINGLGEPLTEWKTIPVVTVSVEEFRDA